MNKKKSEYQMMFLDRDKKCPPCEVIGYAIHQYEEARQAYGEVPAQCVYKCAHGIKKMCRLIIIPN